MNRPEISASSNFTLLANFAPTELARRTRELGVVQYICFHANK